MQGLIGCLTDRSMIDGLAAGSMLRAIERHHQGVPAQAWEPSPTQPSDGGRACVWQEGGMLAAVLGRPRFPQPWGADGLESRAVLDLWRAHGPSMMEHIRGSFALAVVDTRLRSAFLAIDRVGSRSLAFAVSNAGIVFADRADVVAAHPDVGCALDPQGLFNYFYFHDLPAPGTVYWDVQKLLPGEQLLWRRGKLERSFYWHLAYRDAPRSDLDAQSARFHRLLRECVLRAKGDDEVATFLSGGTDSSTVCGVLAEVTDRAPHAYSIGFDADGFDETAYARVAAKHFGLRVREYYLQPQDVLAAISVISERYDEPFANESAVSAYYCAVLASADGYRIMLAGDGGDEIFGGNARYAKQKVFEAYLKVPASLRHRLIEPFSRMPGLDRLPPARKLQSYIRQANILLPERMESYNFIYRQPLEEMFAADFLAAVDVNLPSAWLKDAYERADTTHFINRMLHLDLKFTLADNDLRKVNRMTEAAGIEVRYPLLDDEMVEFSGGIPPDWKVRGQYLRWFFKKALKGFLPDEIINKRKHGFGLPFGVWARDYAPLRERVEDRLSDFKRRGFLNPAYIDHVRNEHMTGHATYFGKLIWVILTLEEWLAARGL